MTTPCAPCKGYGNVRVVTHTATVRIVTLKDCPHCNGLGEVMDFPARQE